MVDSCDEIEIKIEYNESFESDPLCDEIQITNDFSTTPEDSLKTIQTTNWYKSIDDVGNYVCSFCERTYTSVTTLRFHVNMKHPEQAITVKNCINKQRRNSKHRCHLCRSRFMCITELKNHVKNTHGYDNIEKSCLLCNGLFNTSEELTDHLLCCHNVRHKNILICKVCGYRTHKTYRFIQHKHVHMQQKPHKCQFCDYCTSHLYNLKSHEKIHNKDRLQIEK